MATFYATFLPKLAMVVELLHALECEDTQFVWSPECQVAFNAIKGSILAYIQQAPFDQCCPMHFTAEASDGGLGTTLTELQGGHGDCKLMY